MGAYRRPSPKLPIATVQGTTGHVGTYSRAIRYGKSNLTEDQKRGGFEVSVRRERLHNVEVFMVNYVK